MSAVTWEDPPRLRTIKNVDAGTVVLVRIWPSDPAAILVPDATGVPPHVRYQAIIAPQGTTAFQHFVEDPASGQIIPVNESIGERPTTSIDGMLTPIEDAQHVDYDLDIGQPFLCPFPGVIQLVDGEFAADRVLTAPYQVSVQTVMPQEVSLEYAGIVEIGGNLFHRRLYRETGHRPLRLPRMTYFNVGAATPILIPRGAVSVQVPVATHVTFYVCGANGGATITAIFTQTIQPGAAMPLGMYSLGKFSAYSGDPGTPNIPWISFEIEVA